MRARRLALSLVLAVPVLASPAAAEITASGTRLSVGDGAPRFYMTYGHGSEPELYAPIVNELKRLGIEVLLQGENCQVLYRGKPIDSEPWPVLRSLEDVPETGEHPCVLVVGGGVFVPVRKLAELAPINVRWDKKTNLMALTPGKPKSNPVAATPTAPSPRRAASRPSSPATPATVPSGPVGVTPDEGGVVLNGAELSQDGNAVAVRVRSSSPVRPRVIYLTNPSRIVMNFSGAHWDAGAQAPTPAGLVRQVRIGHPFPDTASLVLEVDSPLLKVTSLVGTAEGLQASVSIGPAAKPETFIAGAPDAHQQQVIQAIRRRAQGNVKMASRGADGNPIRPPVSLPGRGADGQEPIDPLNPNGQVVAGSLTGRTICVDAGHGGHSAGAKGLNNLEKDLCLQMCLELRRALELRGATVIMPREGDVYVSLDGRTDFANTHNADIFISIHCNSMPRRNTASGSETYWHTPQSVGLARALHPYLVNAVKGRDGGIRNRSFHVIRESNMPSVLLEIAYINNTQDELLLSNGQFHQNLAENIATGVVAYFQNGAQ